MDWDAVKLAYYPVVFCCHCHLMLFNLEKQITSLYELDQTASTKIDFTISAAGKSHSGITRTSGNFNVSVALYAQTGVVQCPIAGALASQSGRCEFDPR